MIGNQEQRHAYYDHDLRVEAYQLSGIVQKFPNHFHDFYVVGFIEGGKRRLWCKGSEYFLCSGDLVLFNPRDNHYCTPVDGEPLDYRAVNISPEVMTDAIRGMEGKEYVLRFTQNVVYQSEAAALVGDVYDAILTDAPRLQKEEAFFHLLEQILQDYSDSLGRQKPSVSDDQINMLCAYMEQHFAENIALEDMLAMTSFGKSYLLRQFTKQVGVSPYRYLQTIRIDKAKKFLEQGVEPIEVAALAGFSHQSHFTNFFKAFIGLTPKQYQRIFAESFPPHSVEKGAAHEV